MARVTKAEKKVDLEAKAVIWSFADGRTLQLGLADLDKDIVIRAALHGISQKGGDSYAGAETVEEAYQWCKETIEGLVAKNWTTRVAGAGGPRTTLLAEAIARISGAELSAVAAKLEEMDEDKIKALRANAQIKLMINTIKGERLAAETASGKSDADVKALFA